MKDIYLHYDYFISFTSAFLTLIGFYYWKYKIIAVKSMGALLCIGLIMALIPGKGLLAPLLFDTILPLHFAPLMLIALAGLLVIGFKAGRPQKERLMATLCLGAWLFAHVFFVIVETGWLKPRHDEFIQDRQELVAQIPAQYVQVLCKPTCQALYSEEGLPVGTSFAFYDMQDGLVNAPIYLFSLTASGVWFSAFIALILGHRRKRHV